VTSAKAVSSAPWSKLKVTFDTIVEFAAVLASALCPPIPSAISRKKPNSRLFIFIINLTCLYSIRQQNVYETLGIRQAAIGLPLYK
jgi:hypothetical protein